MFLHISIQLQKFDENVISIQLQSLPFNLAFKELHYFVSPKK